MVWQTAGASAGTPGDQTAAAAGTLSVGHYQLVRVKTVAATRLTLKDPLSKAYRAQGGQVVRIPEYETVRVEAPGIVVPTAWDGRKGGLTALLARTLLRVDGSINADGAGFRGAAAFSGAATTGCAQTLDGPISFGFSPRGEGVVTSIFKTAPLATDTAGRGNVRNGGGGGNCSYGGGGGGGNGSFGGTAAYYGPSGNGPGLGGAALTGSLRDVLSMGGGGGAGNNASNRGGVGGPGGGVVYVAADTLEGNGTIRSSGALGGSNEGACGGSGAAGALLLRVIGSAACNLQAIGPDGNPANGCTPGGAGGAGHVMLEAASGACAITAVSGVAPDIVSPFVRGTPITPTAGIIERPDGGYVP